MKCGFQKVIKFISRNSPRSGSVFIKFTIQQAKQGVRLKRKKIKINK